MKIAFHTSVSPVLVPTHTLGTLVRVEYRIPVLGATDVWEVVFVAWMRRDLSAPTTLGGARHISTLLPPTPLAKAG